jgi:hypothetical protein
MRGLLLLVAGAIGVGGCGMGGNADVVAEANGQAYRAEQVATVLGRVQGQRPNTEVAEFIATLWVDLTLMAHAIVTTGIPSDSASVAEALWFDLAQARIGAWHDTLMSRRVSVSAEQVAEFYNSGDARMFQHILVTAGPTAADSARAQGTVRQIQAGLRAGQSFASFADQHNTDATRGNGGILPPTPRGGFVQPFDSVAWTLVPGATSGVVETQFGWHFIRRPPLEEVATPLHESLTGRAKQVADSAFSAELIASLEIDAARSGPAAMRAALNDPAKGMSSNREVATWRGGKMTAGEFSRWIAALPPGFPQRLREESDSALRNFAKLLAQNVIMLAQADSAGIPVPAVNWQAMQLSYRVSVEQVAGTLGLSGPEFSDTAATSAAQRLQLASERVNEYILALASGQAERRQLIPGMAARLRTLYPNRINRAGVTRAVELAVAKFVSDSTASGGVGLPPGAVTPAPGGPPVPDGQ